MKHVEIKVLQKSGIILRDKEEEKNSSGLYLLNKEVPNTGVVYQVGSEIPESYVGKKVRFRKEFFEELVINGKTFLFTRDLEASIYYIYEESEE